MRDHIISEIRRLASANGGKPLGREMFSKLTGIKPTKWTGVYWARWGDALKEAGFEPNRLQERYDTGPILSKVAELALSLGRLPTRAEIRLQRHVDRTFPNHSTLSNHFDSNAALVTGLRAYAEQAGEDVLLAILPRSTDETVDIAEQVSENEGLVYLLKSGDFYKIGRSSNIERRVREVTIALPEAVTLIHSIKTDDAAGIEAYWHRRFANKRANGEWFRLSPTDVKAFSKRAFQ